MCMPFLSPDLNPSDDNFTIKKDKGNTEKCKLCSQIELDHKQNLLSKMRRTNFAKK